MKDYYWKEGQCALSYYYPYQLNVILDGIKNPLEFMSPNETRMLVGSTVNPANETKKIMPLFQDRLLVLTTKLNSLQMSP